MHPFLHSPPPLLHCRLLQNMTAFPPAKHDALGLDSLLSPQEREVRDRVRQFAVSGKGWLAGWPAYRLG